MITKKILTKKTDFTVEWLDNISSFRSTGVLAHAYFFMPNGSKNGVMGFNDSPESKWHFTPLGWPVEAYLVDSVHFTPGQKDASGNLIMRASQPATIIGMHELGHNLGLRHDLTHNEAMMYPYVHPGFTGDKVNPKSFEWRDPDIDRLEEHFEPSGIGFRHLNRWRARRVMRHIYNR